MYKYFLTYRHEGLRWLDVVKADSASLAREVLRDRNGEEITDIEIVEPTKLTIDELYTDHNRKGNTADFQG